jgi:hypothetical protein
VLRVVREKHNKRNTMNDQQRTLFEQQVSLAQYLEQVTQSYIEQYQFTQKTTVTSHTMTYNVIQQQPYLPLNLELDVNDVLRSYNAIQLYRQQVKETREQMKVDKMITRKHQRKIQRAKKKFTTVHSSSVTMCFNRRKSTTHNRKSPFSTLERKQGDKNKPWNLFRCYW